MGKNEHGKNRERVAIEFYFLDTLLPVHRFYWSLQYGLRPNT